MFGTVCHLRADAPGREVVENRFEVRRSYVLYKFCVRCVIIVFDENKIRVGSVSWRRFLGVELELRLDLSQCLVLCKSANYRRS